MLVIYYYIVYLCVWIFKQEAGEQMQPLQVCKIRSLLKTWRNLLLGKDLRISSIGNCDLHCLHFRLKESDFNDVKYEV